MAAQLSSHKRVLTRHCNKLETVLTRFKDEQLEIAPNLEELREGGSEEDYRRRLHEALGALEACTSKIERLWQEYAYAVDNIGEIEKSEKDDFEVYSDKIEVVLGSTLDYTVILQGRLRSLITPRRDQYATPRVEIASNTASTTEVKPIVPALPIPTFTGNIWDWDNFWVLFKANVHDQPIPALFKFNHLVSALKGEAYNAVRKFQITEENYAKAVQFLQEKYGDKEDLVRQLLARLERVTLRSASLKDQRVLLEQLQIIMSQLRDKGEQVDSQWLLKQVLAKFPERVQRRVLERKYSMEGSFRMDDLLMCLDKIVSMEEKIALHTSKGSGDDGTLARRDKYPRKEAERVNFQCMYCGGDHKATSCTKFGTPKERSKYLRDHKLCFICASPQHMTSACKKSACFKCQGRHHTSCCFKSASGTRDSAPSQDTRPPSFKTKEKKFSPSKSAASSGAAPQRDQDRRPTNARNVSHESQATQQYSVKEIVERRDTFLPIGELTILDHTTRKLKKIAVLLDSGAECSFIDSSLANDLDLPTLGTTTLRVRTFGSNKVQECMSRKVSLEIWDENGDPYELELLTHDVLTSSLRTPPLIDEDTQFLKSMQIPINLLKDREVTKPQVLLGCDQIWPLIRQDQAHVRLPSGLYLLSTRIGHLLTGKMNNARCMNQVLRKDDEEHEWNNCWSLESKVHMLSLEKSAEVEDEKALWEQYWTLEKEGAEEFTSSEKEVQSLIDEAVMKHFRDTIEKKDDGYYVRLPWKDTTSPLPDNRAIAWKRLISVWNSLQKDEALLEKYNDIFQEQLRLGILEEVHSEKTPVKGRVHYLPHQAVLTPQKSTTKIRVVFDASAHFKDSPSLNDALHRGPVILPKLYGLLLRFRVGRVALISDVEKAFLQVRLHEIDRDATRCLWLRNHKSPPSASNLRVFRFTRVTFGLLCSPFLLAATTHYHLDQCPKDGSLVTEIKENLYVDNLLLTSNTVQEAQRVYETTKEIFNELHMNLREFASNSTHVLEGMREQDRSNEVRPKVLGIRWNVTDDQLEIVCRVAETTNLTKRMVASSVASVYDPMGWVLPLMHKAKIYLQSLWKENVEWDTPLPDQKKIEWRSILKDFQGFEKSLPRFIVPRKADVSLVTCADASRDAFAACTYMCARQSGHLLMAKGKLPSLKSKITIPKMELNAMTLAMRLTTSALTQVSSMVTISKILVLTDSEIVLNWVTGELRHDAGPFIKNRVSEIHKIVEHLEGNGYEVQLGCISSQDNPADCATRGVDKSQLRDHFWWTGPLFLTTPVEDWINAYRPAKVKDKVQESGPEEMNGNALTKTMFSQTTADSPKSFETIRSSNLSTVQRVVAYTLRFIRNSLLKMKLTATSQLSLLLRSYEVGEEKTPNGREMEIALMMLVKQQLYDGV